MRPKCPKCALSLVFSTDDNRIEEMCTDVQILLICYCGYEALYEFISESES